MFLMSEILNFWGSIASLAGVGITLILTFYVRWLGKRQREIDEQYYRHQTITNIRTMSQHVMDILDISTGEDSRSEMELEDNTKELGKYFRNNSVSIRLLIQDCKFTLSKWLTLKQEEREKIQYIINSLQWILDKYFPDKENSNELQQRIWSSHYDELEKKKNVIIQTVENITTTYSQ